MDTLRLGKLIEGEQCRDAVHIACAPMMADSRLSPGEHVGIIREGVAGSSKDPIGIVDPFLAGPVFKGECFWLFLYPGSITSLRHDWTHPSFTISSTPLYSKSEAWLRNYSDEIGISYERLMEGARGYLDNGNYLYDGARLEGINTPDEFWDHYETVTRSIVTSGDRGSFFSCSC